jgi:hypothetical protein
MRPRLAMRPAEDRAQTDIRRNASEARIALRRILVMGVREREKKICGANGT